ncbi:hypothetical protein R3P38DRAFT_3183078 [Favolaschia claudopus]|uniref:Uncharacterized protein n=1 Tax=Favolaschia claudopus TaxID=2862362 RepID=A0AAW0CEF2_9AGAR
MTFWFSHTFRPGSLPVSARCLLRSYNCRLGGFASASDSGVFRSSPFLSFLGAVNLSARLVFAYAFGVPAGHTRCVQLDPMPLANHDHINLRAHISLIYCFDDMNSDPICVHTRRSRYTFSPTSSLFANADKSLALEQHQANEDFEFKLRIEVEDVDEVTTYDIACEYFVNIEERFEEHFPHLLPRLKKMGYLRFTFKAIKIHACICLERRTWSALDISTENRRSNTGRN